MRRVLWTAQLGGALAGWCGVHHLARAGHPTVLALHGFTGTALDWCAVHHHMPPEWGWVAPDLPGHGRTPWSALAPPTLEGLADALADALAALPRPRVLLGYSLGGRIALTLAVRRPAALDALVTVGASAGLAQASARDERAHADAQLAAQLEQRGTAAFLRAWNAGPLFDGQRGVPPAVRRRVTAHRRAAPAAGLAAALRALGTGQMTPLHAQLDRLTMPALFLAGERDTKFVAAAAELAARAPQARAQAVPGALHAVHLERPDQVAAALVSLAGPRRAP